MERFYIKNSMIKILLLSFPLLLFAQPKQELPIISKEAKEIFSIKEKNVHFDNKSYKLFIAQTKNKAQSYKMLFVLDANVHFPMALNLYAKNHFSFDLMIVGIAHNTNLAYDTAQRTRDYTPIQREGKGGGAKEFLNFLHNEIFSLLNEQYPINASFKAFFGHSFGALFGLYVFFEKQDDFSHYFIASPSLWRGLEYHKINSCNSYIFITKGSLEKKTGVNLDKDMKKLLNTLKNCPFKFTLLKDKTHGETIEDSLNLALKILNQE